MSLALIMPNSLTKELKLSNPRGLREMLGLLAVRDRSDPIISLYGFLIYTLSFSSASSFTPFAIAMAFPLRSLRLYLTSSSRVYIPMT